MGIGFIDRWQARRTSSAEGGASAPVPLAGEDATAKHGPRKHRTGRRGTELDEAAMAELFSECGLLREVAWSAGVRLDDGVDSLSALDQLLPSWRDDPEMSEWMGNDAGLYLGTVIRRTVAGAVWRLGEQDRPLVVLRNGLELDVTTIGHGWADEGSPQLAAAYLAATDG